MTSIEGLGTIRLAAAMRPRPAAGAGFRVPEDRVQADAAEATAPADGVAVSLLALQEAPGEPAVRDRAARRHGQAILAALAALQRAMLDGSDPQDVRAGLRALADHVPEAAAPELAAVLSAIALRARIELARRP